MIQAVLFDFWGVLATKRIWLYDEICRQLGVAKTAEIYSCFLDLLHQMELGELQEHGFWQAFCAKAKVAVPTSPDLSLAALYENLTIINPEVVSLATRLRSQGLKVGILSNTDSRAVDYLRRHDILAVFDVAVFSCDVALLKPDPHIYEYALGQLGTPADQTVFVDDREENIRAAAALGLHGMVFSGAEALEHYIDELQARAKAA